MDEERMKAHGKATWLAVAAFLLLGVGAFFVGQKTVTPTIVQAPETVLHKCSYCEKEYETISRVVADEKTSRNECFYCYIKHKDFLHNAYQAELIRIANRRIAEKNKAPKPTDGGK